MNAFTSRESLQGSAYADDANLAARQAIYRFVEHPWPSDGGRVLGSITMNGDELVVDVGCGNGNDLRDLRAAGHRGPLLAVDLSVGMLRSLAPLAVASVNADAGHLPLLDGAADVALAMHMLYHCADIPATVGELRRVVRPGGALVVSTNARSHLQELRELWTATLGDVLGAPVAPWETAAGRFALEDAPQVLRSSFDEVELHRADNRLLVPEVAPVVAYVASTRALSGQGIEAEAWESALSLLADRVRAVIAEDGALALTVVKGVIVSR